MEHPQISAAIKDLKSRGILVERTFEIPGFPAMFRLDGGPEVTERQLVGIAGAQYPHRNDRHQPKPT